MTVFIFADIEGSTRLWAERGDEMNAALERHDDLARELLARFGGRFVKHTGDGFFAVFEGGDPLGFALAFQKDLEAGDRGLELRARLALHAGGAHERAGDFFGPAVNAAARLNQAAWGGQVVLSAAAAAEVALPPGAILAPLGSHLFRNLDAPLDVFQLQHPELPARDFPPLRSLSPRARNLPPAPTSFIGRQSELAQVRAVLAAPGCRLLTLVGPGGMGKTRLAAEGAAALAAEFSGGAYFVPLAPVNDPSFLPAAAAEALGFVFGPRGEPLAQLLGYLADKELLLVFDNFEHVVAGAAVVTRILDAAPGVKVLVTSRARLGLRNERLLEIGGMGLPAEAAAPDFESYGGVELFVEAARRANPDFDLPPADRPVFLRLARALVGMPLGLELAASLTRVLSLEEVAAEVERNLEILAGEESDVPARHRSIRAVFDYSYELLGEDLRRVLARLAVFRNSFTRAAAEAVADARLPALAALIDASLVRKAGSSFELHPLVRQFAAERLEGDAAAREETRARHAAFFAGRLRARAEDLIGIRQLEAVDELSASGDDIRAAWYEASARGDVALLDVASEGLFNYYYTRSMYVEAAETFGAAAAALRKGVMEPGAKPAAGRVYGRLLARRARGLLFTGRAAEARSDLREAVALARRAGDSRETLFALNGLGILAINAGDYPLARRINLFCLKRARALDYREGAAAALTNLGTAASLAGDLEEGKRYFEECLVLMGADGPPARMAQLYQNLSTSEQYLGRPEAALALAEKSLAAAREVGNRRIVSYALHNLGVLNHKLGRRADATRFLEESLALKRELNDSMELPLTLGQLGTLAAEGGDCERARILCYEGERISKAGSSPSKMLFCRTHLVDVEIAAGEYARAFALLREGIRLADEIRSVSNETLFLAQFAKLLFATGAGGRGSEVLGALAASPFARRHGDEAAALKREFAAAFDPAAFEAGKAVDWKTFVAGIIAGEVAI